MTRPQRPSLKTGSKLLDRYLLLVCTSIALGSISIPSRAPGSVLLDPDPESSTTHFGYSIAVIGDIDGDGHPDLAVGAPYQDGDFDNSTGGFGPPQNVGKVWLINGANLTVIRTLDDPQFQMEQSLKFGGQFGNSIAAVGDLNHDGITDVFVGVPHHIDEEANENEVNSGEAFVFSGKDGSILFTLEAPEPAEGARFGYVVAGIADVNGDGTPDLLVGEPKRDVDEDVQDTGAAYLFSGADGTLLRTLLPPSQNGKGANGRFGEALADAGDLNQDGVDDILVGAPGNGRVYIVSGATGAVLQTVSSPVRETLPSFGYALSGGKDIDGDGTLDFVVGAPLQNKLTGAAYVFNGDGTLQRTLKASPETFAKFGSSVRIVDDLTRDGRPEIIVGAPDHTVNDIPNAGEAFIFRGNNGKLLRLLTSDTPKAYAGYGYVSLTADLTGNGQVSTITGTPFEDADLPEAKSKDIETHLQIGQIEVQ